MMQRRIFLQLASGAASLAGQQSQAHRLRLGFDSYTLRGYGFKAVQFLDYADKMRLDTVQLSDLNDYASLEPDYLEGVKQKAKRLGILIEGGVSSICPTSANYHKEYGDAIEYTRRGLKATKAVGATCMRCFIGGGAERHSAIPLEQHLANTLKVLRAVRTQALDLGVKIAIENHGDLHAWELRELIESAGRDFVGACLDTGNAVSVFEDPLDTLEILGPHVLTTHIRDSAVYEHPRGAVMQWVALGDGSVDLPRFFERFRQICPNAAVQLEILTGTPPRILPYLESEFWKDFPKARASEFARFVALAKRGRPFTGSMVMAAAGQRPEEYQAAFKAQQRIDLERSFEYAKKTLKLGVRADG